MGVCESIALMNFFLLIRAYLYAAHVEDDYVLANPEVMGRKTSEGAVDTVSQDNVTPPKPPPPAWVSFSSPSPVDRHMLIF